RIRPVDQVEVDVVQPEPAQARVEGPRGLVAAVAVVPELRGDVDLVALQARGAHRSSHALLVVVRGGGVDVPVASLEGLGGDALGSWRIAGWGRMSTAANGVPSACSAATVRAENPHAGCSGVPFMNRITRLSSIALLMASRICVLSSLMAPSSRGRAQPDHPD